MTEAIHIHEDDWGLRNLYPAAARTEAAADLDAAQRAGEKNRDPSGFGWTDIHVIKPPRIGFAEVGLKLADAVAALAPIMPRVKTFNATATAGFDSEKRDPYGSYETEAWCYGFGAHCFIKLDAKDELVRDIWFELMTTEEGPIAGLRAAIEAVDALAPSVLVDYRLHIEGPAGDPAFLDAYFAAHAAEEAEIARRIEEARRRDAARPPGAPRTVAPPPKASR